MNGRGSGDQGSSSHVSRGGGNRYGKSKKKSYSKKPLVTTEEMVQTEKKGVLAQKREELEEVWNKHDMLVCNPIFPSFLVIFVSNLFRIFRLGRFFTWRVIP
jgi:hypothetical protein